jgi:hypothetical protein
LRPGLGRIERTRFGNQLARLSLLGQRRLAGRLQRRLDDESVAAAHAVVHDLDFGAAYDAAARLGLPYFLTVHDDLDYLLRRRPDREQALATLREVWARATWRFVISRAMGEEYSRRYGAYPYSIVTDGLESVPDAPRPSLPDQCRVYFMGLIHLSYEANFAALVDALATIASENRRTRVACACRSGSMPLKGLRDRFSIDLLPFGSEEDVQRDLQNADFLYLPLPFAPEHEAMVRYSLSTKLVTYLGSGLPIIYHGPAYGSAYSLLATNGAAYPVVSLDPDELTNALRLTSEARHEIARNALSLARRSFSLEQQRETFWSRLGTPRESVRQAS